MKKGELFIGTGLLCLALLIRYGPNNFLLVPLHAFAMQMLWFCTGTFILACLLRRHFLVISGLTGALLIATQIQPYFHSYSNNNRTTQAKSHLAIAHFNVLKPNTNYQQTIQAALKTKADLLSFQEVGSRWAKKLKGGLQAKYPYFKTIVRKDNFGLAVFARHPIEDLTVKHWQGRPNISGQLNVDGKTFRFIASHTSSPVAPKLFKERNQHIQSIAKYAAKVKTPLFAIGDYNAVPWDDSIQTFTQQTTLQDSRQGFTPTFPAWLPIRIPIDYIFHSSQWHCISFKTIDGTSSDHLGILGKYNFVSDRTAQNFNQLN